MTPQKKLANFLVNQFIASSITRPELVDVMRFSLAFEMLLNVDDEDLADLVKHNDCSCDWEAIAQLLCAIIVHKDMPDIPGEDEQEQDPEAS